MTTETPEGAEITAALPQFDAPADDPPDPAWTSEDAPEPEPEAAPQRVPVPTSTRQDAAAYGEVIIGLLGIVAALAGKVARMRQRDLRPPRREELQAVADPLGRIMARRQPSSALDDAGVAADVADGVAAAAGVAGYVLSDPIERPSVSLGPLEDAPHE